MDATEFQSAVGRTLRLRKRGLTTWETDLVIAALGLAEEAGEVVALVMKHVDAGADLSHEAMVEELGDVQAHVAKLATLIGVSLRKTQERNVSKLRVRFPEACAPTPARDAIAEEDKR